MKQHHIREGSISKYCLGIILLYPHLKKNRFKPFLLKLKKIIPLTIEEYSAKYEKPEDTTLLTGDKDSVDSIFEGDKTKKSASELTKDDVAAYAKRYAELLGGEKADRQAIFDAMLDT